MPARGCLRWAWLLLALAVLAQPAAADSRAADLEASPEVWLMTVEPGAVYWQRFGHNAIVLRDPREGHGSSYNFGYFDFEQPGFLLRFLRGRMLYQAVALDAADDIDSYLADGRRVWMQRLDLDPDAVRVLQEHLRWHVQPEQRDYRYDYYEANCSTKVRDALDLALGGAWKAATAHRSHGWTWRRFTRAHAHGLAWLYLGTDLALGQPVDRPISIWEEGFIPAELKRQAREMRLADGRPLLLEERLLPASADHDDHWPQAPDLRPVFLAGGLALALLFVLLDRFGERSPTARRLEAGLAVGYALLSALGFTCLALLWLATDHAAAWRNENLFLLSPLWLLTLPLWWQRQLGRTPAGRSHSLARTGAQLALLSALLGLVLKVLRSFDQANIEWYLLLLPLLVCLQRAVFREGTKSLEGTRARGHEGTLQPEQQQQQGSGF